MRYLTAALAVFLLTCATVQAQTGIPGPTPQPSGGVSEELQVLDQIASRLETMSATDAGTTNGAVLMLGGGFFVLMLVILIVVVWIARGGLTPLFQTIQAERQRAQKAELDEERLRLQAAEDLRIQNEHRVKMAEALQKAAEAQERMATAQGNTETKEEATKGRGEAVVSINTHTDQAHADTLIAIERLLERALKGVNFAQSKDEQRMSQEHETADLTLPQVQTTLMEAQKQVKKLHDTGPLGQPSPPTNDKHPPEA